MAETEAQLEALITGEAKEDDAVKAKEQAIYKLSELYAKSGRGEQLRQLLQKIRPFFASIPKAKTAKIVRTVIDNVEQIPNSTRLMTDLCLESIEWARQEKRTFLRQRIEARLSAIYFKNQEYSKALQLIGDLIREVKRLDDKLLLLEIQLIESQIHHALRNLAKARASLTSARTSANAIYCPPALQAEIDMQAGILHADEKDYKTAYSYLYEAMEGYSTLEDPRAMLCLKYMLLCKIMMNATDEVSSIMNSKAALKFAGPDIDAMRAVAKAHSSRSLKAFEEAQEKYKKELSDDLIISSHLSALYNTLLEQNLCRIIEPFTRVEIAHVAELIKLPRETVEAKLSQMILDKKFRGILDQGANCLIVYEDQVSDKTYPAALETVSNMSNVVGSLFERARKLS
eukprot:tig00000615_g2608.t1